MAAKQIEVSISRRILHVGPAAYPLANIASVQWERVKFRRWRHIRSFLSITVICVGLSIGLTNYINYQYRNYRDPYDPNRWRTISQVKIGSRVYIAPGLYLNLARYVPAIVIGVSFLVLLIYLARTWRRYYALIITTAGIASTVLINPDLDLITDLVAKITHALEDPEDPQNHFHVTAYNYTNNNFGRQNAQFGQGSTMSGV